jgi:hypothetical protein
MVGGFLRRAAAHARHGSLRLLTRLYRMALYGFPGSVTSDAYPLPSLAPFPSRVSQAGMHFAAGCDDGTLTSREGMTWVHFAHQA